jgi:hypothetical protein
MRARQGCHERSKPLRMKCFAAVPVSLKLCDAQSCCCLTNSPNMPSMISGFALLCITVCFTVVHGRSHPDLVTSLPGLKSSLNFQHFAGYLNVNSSNNRNLFYWFTKASNETNDLVLWLNGGPGCSSVSGFFTENGPFVVASDGSIQLNNFAWNTRANVLWLEAPAGVRNFVHFNILSPP